MNKKHFSKALFYDEKNNIINSMIGYSLIFFIAIVHFLVTSNKPNIFAGGSFVLISDVPYFLMFIICLTTVFHSYSKKEIKYSFILTQPCSRDSIIITRTVAYMTSYGVPIMLYGIIASILIATNNHVVGVSLPYLLSLLSLKLFSLFIMLTLTVTLVQLFQMLFGKNSAAGILPVTLAFLVTIELSLIHEIISDKISYFKKCLDFIINILSGPNGLLTIMGRYNGNPSFTTSVVLIFIIALIIYICILLNRKIKIENMSGSFIFKPVENIFKVIISILFVIIFTVIAGLIAAFICYILNVSLSLKYFLIQYEQTILLILDIIWLALTVLVYKLIGKVMNKKGRV